MRRRAVVLFFCGLVAASAGAKNPYGVMTMLNSGSYDSSTGALYLGLVRDMAGDWGHARQYAYAGPQFVDRDAKFLLTCRGLHLTPILYVGSIPGHHDGNGLPKMGPGLTYETVANVIASWVQALLNEGYKIPYLEVFNEANITVWQPGWYAQYVIDVSAAVKAVDPDVKILSGGFSGAATAYIDGMFTAYPAVKDAIDVWSLHIVPGNQPPWVHTNEYDSLCYLDALAKLGEYGAYYPILITEGAYYLNDATDPSYPVLTPALRAEYMSVLWQDFYAPDASILGFTPWQFGNPSGGSSQYQSTWINENYTPNLMYDTIAAIPKTGGADWMPTGSNTVSGTVTDAATGLPLQRMIVYLMPGPYAAVSDENGDYAITGVPDGSYTGYTFSDTYGSRWTADFTLGGAGKTAETWDPNMVHNGYMRNSDFETGTLSPDGWGRVGSDSAFSVTSGIKSTGAKSQRIDCGPEDRYLSQMSDYYTVQPGLFYTARVWARTSGVLPPESDGAILRLEFYDDGPGVILQSHEAATGGGSNNWAALTITARAPANADRLRLELEANGTSGTVYFDDAYVHHATEPAPEVVRADYHVFDDGWVLIGVPIGAADPGVEVALGDVTRAGNNLTNAVFGYDAGSGYSMYPTDFLDETTTHGYWLLEQNPVTTVSVRGVTPAGDTVVPLTDAWNIVASPYGEAVDLGAATVSDGVDTYELDDPAALTFVDRYAYYYGDSGYVTVDLQAGTETMEPWYGYWVRALLPGLELTLPEPYEMGSLSGTVQSDEFEPLENVTIIADPGGYWASTNELGQYSIDRIPAGTYSVSADVKDYSPQTIPGVVIVDGANTVQDFTLVEVPPPFELQNPGFEMGNLSYWSIWQCVNSAYTSFFADTEPYEGDWFCGSAASYTTCSGGLFQRVSAVPSENYLATAYINTYRLGGVMMDCVSRIGIDPTGGEDILSPSIVWSDWYESQAAWMQIGVEAVALDDKITYFLQHQQISTIEWHQNCYDACWIEIAPE